MLAIALLVLGVISRLLIHIPNFTPVIALAFFGGYYLSRRQSVLLPLVLLAVTDIIIGFHETMLFTWGSVVVIALIGQALKSNKKWSSILGGSLASCVLFFIITNLGVWLVSGMYPLNAAGLSECFVLAIPFFGNSLVSTLIYTGIFFGAYEWASVRIRDTRFAHVL